MHMTNCVDGKGWLLLVEQGACVLSRDIAVIDNDEF